MKVKKSKNKIILKKDKRDFEFWFASIPMFVRCLIYITIQIILAVVYVFYMRYSTVVEDIAISVFWNCVYCFIAIGSTRLAFRSLPFFTMVILYTIGNGLGQLIGMYMS